MARPTLNTIVAGLATWDSAVDENFSVIVDGPFPMFQAATTGALPSAGSYDLCLAIVGDTDPRIYISVSSAWVLYDKVADNVSASTATTVADLVTDYNELRTALIDGGIMASS